MPSLGPAGEDYLKAIYKIQSGGNEVTTSALAAMLSVSDASVTSMSKRLAQMGLVKHELYRGVELTEAGRRIALEVIRHHRLLELYLAEVLGYSWDEVHAEADRLEHHISEEFEERIDILLGRPTVDPHGDPIPSKDLELTEAPLIPLDRLEPNEPAVIQRVSDRNPEMLRYLASLGMFPNVALVVRDRAPFGGPIYVVLGDREHAVGPELAGHVFVRRRDATAETRR
ncbi:MAG: metal-dependent transcriptional regulator [Dehalococcoidia bacterium]|nr:metal-dependent transcriptional regulator [Dehalococcoidia bacterium]